MNTQKTIIILGGGSGGLVAANELRKKTDNSARIILIDKNKTHIYAASFIYLMLGKRSANKIQKSLFLLERKGIEFINDEIVKIEPENKEIKTKKSDFHYDYLILSLGAELAPDKIQGLSTSGFNLYELQEVERLRDNLNSFTEGKVAIVISSLPFKCPAAPYEAAFLLDEYFQKKGIRDRTEISIFTPEALPMPSAGPEIGKIIRSMIEARNILFNPEVNLSSVDSNKKELSFEDGKIAKYDLLIFVPPHQGPKVIRDSGLGNEIGWIPVDGRTLRTEYNNVFAIGDGASITLSSGKPLPKAGVFAHFEAEVVSENIIAEIKGLSANKEYDGRAYCFLEIGFGRAGFAGGNFYAEPTPVVKMRKPGRWWHWGKVLFEKYWLWRWL
ncbi:MAG: NAD(P)/FAD-dependent oxidoreductase [Actinobacteria bacterium]|nr:NAD(P)/FAD-dependent oxidoreductase [Actinomycetota bacterium]